MNKNSLENKSAYFPVKKSDFKPRVDKNACQYCGYTSNLWHHVREHVNSQHEMQEWFKCNICKYVAVHGYQMKFHLRSCHKLKVVGTELKNLIIKNPKEIRKHKKAMIERRNLKTKICKKPEFIPIDEDNFKRRKYPMICQYCGFRGSEKSKVDDHVNGCHEMNQWYQCNQCPHATLYKGNLRLHVLSVHNQKLTSSIIHELIIKDQDKIDQLKKEKIRKKKGKDEFSKMSPEQLSKEPKFIPIDKADFKPRIYPLICQYCGYSSKIRQKIDNHVNKNHELTTWFKCDECDFATLIRTNIRSHLKDLHSRKNENGDKIKKLIVTDQKEIDQLRMKRMERKRAIDRADFKPRIYPRICQYCGFTASTKRNISFHVNSFHEMVDWYQCECCEFVTLDRYCLKYHLKIRHSKDLSKDRLEGCLIKDQEVIDCLRNKRMQCEKPKEEFSILPLEQLSNEPKSLPIDDADIKCNLCGFSSTCKGTLKSHFSKIHNKTISYRELAKSITTGPDKTCHPRKKKTDKSKSNPRKTAFDSDSCKSVKEEEIPIDFSYNEDNFQSESNDEYDANFNTTMKLKPLSIVLERLKTTITRGLCVSSDNKVEGCSTEDIKKEDMSMEDEPGMEGVI